MSDRYRPPAGPKSTRGAPPAAPKNGWKSSNSQQYYNGPLPKRYKERDNYRPNLIERQKQSQPPGESLDRPAGPSAYREGYSQKEGYGQKRSYPDQRYRKEENPNKRRDFTTKQQEPQVNRNGPPAKRPDSKVQDRTPRGPRSSGPAIPQDRKFAAANKKKAPVQQNKKPLKLRPSQMYLLYSVRPDDLYQRVQQVGEGTYGKVYKVINRLTNEFVALKRLRLESEREGFPITAMREIKLLQSFDHPNIVGLLEMMVEHNQIFMVFDYLDHDLTGLLTHPVLKLTEGHRKTIFKQLMEGMNYLHGRRVIHRDIKGSNILLDHKGVLKVADFGLARTMKVLNNGESPDYTNRVITIWYRPPELLLGSTDYGREVDIWGVGCLLMELYTKSATFQGAEELTQLFKIFEIMGTPTTESWPGIENFPWFEMLKPQINRRSRFEEDFKPLMTEDSFDLALKLLSLVPSKRLTAQEALDHPYFQNDPKPEPLTFMETLEGEWHEFETKKRRREERKRLADLKSTGKGRDLSVPPTQPGAPKTVDLSTTQRSESQTPGFDRIEVDAPEASVVGVEPAHVKPAEDEMAQLEEHEEVPIKVQEEAPVEAAVEEKMEEVVAASMVPKANAAEPAEGEAENE